MSYEYEAYNSEGEHLGIKKVQGQRCWLEHSDAPGKTYVISYQFGKVNADNLVLDLEEMVWVLSKMMDTDRDLEGEEWPLISVGEAGPSGRNLR